MPTAHSREVILALDVGTSSMRAIAYDLEGTVLCTFSRAYSPTFRNDGAVRQDPGDWRVALYALLGEAAAFLEHDERHAITISLTSQRASVIPIDEHGEAFFSALMWQDMSTREECRLIEDSIPARELYHLTGMRVHPYFSAPRILWLRRYEPEAYRKATHLVGVQDFVAFILTGRLVTDHTQASRTLLFNVSRLDWDQSVLDELSIERTKLPQVVAPGSVIGETTPEFRERTGFAAGVPVVIAGGDQQVAATGLRITPNSGIGVNNGTGAFVVAASHTPEFDPEMRTLCTPGAIPNTWDIEAGVLATGAVYNWLSRQLRGSLELTQELDTTVEDDRRLDALSRCAESSPVGANGLVLLPNFAGIAAPDWNPDSRGVLVNLRLSSSVSDIARAAIEGIAVEIANNVHLVQSVTGRQSKVVVAGGLSQSQLFVRSLTDAVGFPVEVSGISEATALGAMITASVSLGRDADFASAITRLVPGPGAVLEPIPQYVSVFERHRAFRKDLHQALVNADLYRKAQELHSQQRAPV